MAAGRVKWYQAALLMVAGAMLLTTMSWHGCAGQPQQQVADPREPPQPSLQVPPDDDDNPYDIPPDATFQQVGIAGETFNLELAVTDDQRFQGLSDRRAIDPQGGMLFVFPDADERAFVMRRCLVPMELLYVSPEGTVVSMHEMQVVPYHTPEMLLKRYRSGWPAQFVIELAAGSIDRLGVKVGDPVEMPLDALKAEAR